jgi:hypothetical protein
MLPNLSIVIFLMALFFTRYHRDVFLDDDADVAAELEGVLLLAHPSVEASLQRPFTSSFLALGRYPASSGLYSSIRSMAALVSLAMSAFSGRVRR